MARMLMICRFCSKPLPYGNPSDDLCNQCADAIIYDDLLIVMARGDADVLRRFDDWREHAYYQSEGDMDWFGEMGCE